MSSGIPKPDVDKQKILEALPLEISRICVTTKDGDTRYRKVEEVEHTDILMFNKNNQPVVMRGKAGRPSQNPKLALPTVQDTTKFVPVPNRFSSTISTNPTTTQNITTIDDPMVVTVREDPESLDVLHTVMMGLAEESAAMAVARKMLESQGKNTSNVSAKRVSALRAIGDTWIKRKEQIGSSGLDLDSTAFKRVFGFIMETFRTSLIQSNIRPEQVEVIFAKLAKKMDDDWMKEAKKRVEGDE